VTRRILVTVCAGGLALWTASVQGATIHVNADDGDDAWSGLCETWDGGTCGPKATVQAGIDAATDGDEVVLAPGRYAGDGNRNIRFRGKAITLRSTNPADWEVVMATIIDARPDDARQLVSGLQLGEDTVVDGITIANATLSGVLCGGGSPTMRRCRITRNLAPYSGVYCTDGTVLLESCEISDNGAGTIWGGGIFASARSFVIARQCRILGNNGAASASAGVVFLDRCEIEDNLYCAVALTSGGQAFVYDSRITNVRNIGTSFRPPILVGPDCALTLWHSRVEDNVGADSSMTVMRSLGDLTVDSCVFARNTRSGPASPSDATIWVESGEAYIARTMFLDNTGPVDLSDGSLVFHDNLIAGTPGDAIRIQGGEATIANCTIADNDGAGIVVAAGAPPITNTIVWNNGGGSILVEDGATPVVTYSDIEGGTGATWFGEGSIDAGPGFALPGDYHLTASSPCVETGGTPLPDSGSRDLDGGMRLEDADDDGTRVVDMGAYEYDPNASVIAVVPDVLDFGDVSGGIAELEVLVHNLGGASMNWTAVSTASWATPIPASGTTQSTPTPFVVQVDPSGILPGWSQAEIVVDAANARSAARTIGVRAYRPGTLHVPSERFTIQDALDAAEDGDVIVVAPGRHMGYGNARAEAHGKAVTILGTDPADPEIIDSTVVDGYTGHMSGITLVGDRHGIVLDSASGISQLAGLTLRSDAVITGDGAVAVHDCRFDHGAYSAIECKNNGSGSVTVNRCSFEGVRPTDDSGRSDGSGTVHVEGAKMAIRDCVFAQNAPPHVLALDAKLELDGCLFVPVAEVENNEYNHAIIIDGTSQSRIRNCTFAWELASGNYDWDNCIVQITGSGAHAIENTILDVPSWEHCAISYSLMGGTLDISYTTIDGTLGVPHTDGTTLDWGPGVIYEDPGFADADGPDNDPFTWQDNDYRPATDSPCVNAGDPAYVADPPDRTDLDGRPRVIYDRVDIGAYEFAWPGDSDFDGDVDLWDYGAFTDCFTGPGRPASDVCGGSDFDGDGDVDLTDYGVFLSCYNGPENPPGCG
jgi:hypothetical protein